MAELALKGGQALRTRPFPKWPVVTEDEVNAVMEVVESGKWGHVFTERTERFCDRYAEYHGVDYAIPVSNGSTALEVALRNAGIGPGDEVITPPSTWVATNLAPLIVGADVVFADVLPDTYCIDPDKIEEAITACTRAVIPVHIGGYLCEMDRIMEIAREHDLVVIEDCAQAHGSRYKGQVVGSIGHFGCFSFEKSKLITAGEGGMVTTNAESLGDLAFGILGVEGRQGQRLADGRINIGWNYRMTEFQIAVLLAQLDRFDEQREKRIENAEYLKPGLAAIDGIEPLRQSPEQNYYSYIFKYDATRFKDVPKQRFMEALEAEGIPLFSSPSHQHPAYRSPKFRWPGKSYSDVFCPVAEKAFEQEAIGFQGTWILLGEKEDMDDIVNAILKIRENIEELV